MVEDTSRLYQKQQMRAGRVYNVGGDTHTHTHTHTPPPHIVHTHAPSVLYYTHMLHQSCTHTHHTHTSYTHMLHQSCTHTHHTHTCSLSLILHTHTLTHRGDDVNYATLMCLSPTHATYIYA